MKAVDPTTLVKKFAPVNLSRERPRNGPEILNVGSQLKITNLNMKHWVESTFSNLRIGIIPWVGSNSAGRKFRGILPIY